MVRCFEIELTYKDPAGRLGNELIYRDREPSIEIAEIGRPWSFDGVDGQTLDRSPSEFGWLFDPSLSRPRHQSSTVGRFRRFL